MKQHYASWYARAQSDLNHSLLHHSRPYLFFCYIRDQIQAFTRWRYSHAAIYSLFIMLLLYFKFRHNSIAFFLSVATVLLFIPMAHHEYLGLELSFPAMIIIASMFGFSAGIAIGKIPNFIGHFITHRIDLDLVYELLVFIPIAYIASLLSLNYLMIGGIILSLVYNFGYLGFFMICKLIHPKHLIYALTHFLVSVFTFMYLLPLLI